jgi:hypothetical protein
MRAVRRPDARLVHASSASTLRRPGLLTEPFRIIIIITICAAAIGGVLSDGMDQEAGRGDVEDDAVAQTAHLGYVVREAQRVGNEEQAVPIAGVQVCAGVQIRGPGWDLAEHGVVGQLAVAGWVQGRVVRTHVDFPDFETWEGVGFGVLGRVLVVPFVPCQHRFHLSTYLLELWESLAPGGLSRFTHDMRKGSERLSENVPGSINSRRNFVIRRPPSLQYHVVFLLPVLRLLVAPIAGLIALKRTDAGKTNLAHRLPCIVGIKLLARIRLPKRLPYFHPPRAV